MSYFSFMQWHAITSDIWIKLLIVILFKTPFKTYTCSWLLMKFLCRVFHNSVWRGCGSSFIVTFIVQYKWKVIVLYVGISLYFRNVCAIQILTCVCVSHQKCLIALSCPSVCPHVSVQLPLHAFLWNLILQTFTKICPENRDMQTLGTSHEDLNVFHTVDSNTCSSAIQMTTIL